VDWLVSTTARVCPNTDSNMPMATHGVAAQVEIESKV